MHSRVTYNAGTPGADTNTYNMYNSVIAGGGPVMGARGVKKVALDLKNSHVGTLKAYKSDDHGVNWNQIYQESIAAAAATSSWLREWLVESYADWKLDWVNGGSAQTTWEVDVSLLNERGGGDVRVSNPAAAVDEDAGVIKTEQRYTFTNITSAATTVVKASAGFLHALTINTLVAAATITLYDNTSGAAPAIGLITLPAAGAGDMPCTLPYNVSFATGLTIVTSGATDITVSYR